MTAFLDKGDSSHGLYKFLVSTAEIYLPVRRKSSCYSLTLNIYHPKLYPFFTSNKTSIRREIKHFPLYSSPHIRSCPKLANKMSCSVQGTLNGTECNVIVCHCSPCTSTSGLHQRATHGCTPSHSLERAFSP